MNPSEFDAWFRSKLKAAKAGPVFITDRGKPAHVLLSIEEYQRLTKQRRNIADSLAMPGIADIEFEPPRVTLIEPIRAASLESLIAAITPENLHGEVSFGPAVGHEAF